MTQSLRGRLLIGVISLVVVGLLIADIATYAALQSSLVSQLDDQLKSGHNAAISGLGGPNEGSGPPSGSGLPAGSVIELLSPSGAVLIAKRLEVPGSTPSSAMPVLPQHLPAASEKAPATLTLAGTGGVSQYRAAIWPEDFFSGNYVVLAIPMTDVLSTLSRLLELEAVISAGVVVATAILALIIIRISLRPLEKMGTVANEIAAGDLSRRVEPATGKTEIGRLGLALNGMLSQIESAFAERTASNRRLRRFVADASHELRTPLTSIRGYSEMLRRGAAESPTDAELARRRIEEEAIRMTGLVDDMLVLARVDQGRPLDHEPVDSSRPSATSTSPSQGGWSSTATTRASARWSATWFATPLCTHRRRRRSTSGYRPRTAWPGCQSQTMGPAWPPTTSTGSSSPSIAPTRAAAATAAARAWACRSSARS